MSPGIGDGAGALFALNSATDNDAYPIWQNSNGGGMPGDAATFMFGPGTVVTPQGTVSTTGQTLIKWGFLVDPNNNPPMSGPGLGTITFPQPFPNNCFVVIPVIFLANAGLAFSVTIRSKSATNFTYIINPITGPSALGELQYIAIGN